MEPLQYIAGVGASEWMAVRWCGGFWCSDSGLMVLGGEGGDSGGLGVGE